MRIIPADRASAVFGLALFLCLCLFRPGLAQNAQEVEIDSRPGDIVYFSRDSSRLSPEGRETLVRQARWLNEHPKVTVMIEGHTDSRGSRAQNRALGQRRADEVRQSLVALGIAGRRIAVISYGEDRPMARCEKEQCWSTNRRAMTVIASDGGAN